MVMECAVDGNLRDYLEKNTLTWNKKIKLAYQLASAVSCLHDEGIVHRDLVIFIIKSYLKEILFYLF